MSWFQKTQQPEDIWEVADDQPMGDIEAAQKIRAIVNSARAIAETIAKLGGRNAESEKAAQTARYQAAVKRALEITKQISDDQMRDVSVSQIIELSVKAGHLKTARILLRAIRSEQAQRELIAAHPDLGTDG